MSASFLIKGSFGWPSSDMCLLTHRIEIETEVFALGVSGGRSGSTPETTFTQWSATQATQHVGHTALRPPLDRFSVAGHFPALSTTFDVLRAFSQVLGHGRQSVRFALLVPIPER